jgi:hypothetical protein
MFSIDLKCIATTEVFILFIFFFLQSTLEHAQQGKLPAKQAMSTTFLFILFFLTQTLLLKPAFNTDFTVETSVQHTLLKPAFNTDFTVETSVH